MTKMLFFIGTALLIGTSCNKNNDSEPGTPTTQARTKTEILTYKPWMMQEEYDLENNVLNKYERGASGNTVNYDNELLTFANGGSGSFKDIQGNTYPISWSFQNSEQTKMMVTIQFPGGNVPLNYNMVQLSDSSFSMTFNRVNPLSGITVLVVAKRVWKP